jgi:hypothetical protein
MHQRRLSYRLVLIYFFIMRKTSRVKLIPRKNITRGVMTEDTSYKKDYEGRPSIFATDPLLLLCCLVGLTEKLIKSRRGVSDAANCGSVRCGPTLSKAHLLHVLLKKGYVLRASVERRNAKEIALPCCLRSFFIYRP